jgi:large subunit ribosomal protein L21
MQAIIVTGGKQYVVNEGDTLFIEKLPVEAGRYLRSGFGDR